MVWNLLASRDCKFDVLFQSHWDTASNSKLLAHSCMYRYGGERGLSDASCSGPCSPGYYCNEGSASPTQVSLIECVFDYSSTIRMYLLFYSFHAEHMRRPRCVLPFRIMGPIACL